MTRDGGRPVLSVEVNSAFMADNPVLTTRLGTRVMVTPPVDKDYWLLRVKVSEDQAIVAFPKFFTFGIGFAQESVSWNTNLPYTTEARQILRHIAKNKGDESIADEDCVRAIEMLQETLREMER